MSEAKQSIVVTMGEPAGIGAEIALGAWLRLRETDCAFYLLHDPVHVSELAQALSLRVPIKVISHPSEAREAFSGALPVMPVHLPAPIRLGQPDSRNAASVTDAIRLAVELTVTGQATALVTNPIQKSVLYESGFPFPGHTEFLEELSGAGYRATMMLASEELKVVPVSIHEALAAAVSGLSTQKIVNVALATASGLSADFGIPNPRLAITGLNPHAGEGGSMGREEIDTIAPAIEILKREGIEASGPYPPDTMFTPRARQTYDAAICMYHDQALIPLKTLDVDGGVNITLGLPFVRTSPDHGTALDIAGRGIADPGSLISAIRMAASIAEHRARSKKGMHA
ncbi:MAG: 4-hydroxythreonine-4-phosphate dehydrogenase PdxA [Mesorhizobium sp.]|nr:4-hydroxythreonine-4-phosphate dehydrogenase PdxA [Mesorhizobium sp.]MBL8580443.1 4-hydroxythreonine-4-phosphate dehydrogenase PdxA [Mesorhizobium sp.]